MIIPVPAATAVQFNLKRKCHAFYIHKLRNILDCEIWANLISFRDMYGCRRYNANCQEINYEPDNIRISDWMEWIPYKERLLRLFLFSSSYLQRTTATGIAFVFALNAHAWVEDDDDYRDAGESHTFLFNKSQWLSKKDSWRRNFPTSSTVSCHPPIQY